MKTHDARLRAQGLRVEADEWDALARMTPSAAVRQHYVELATHKRDQARTLDALADDADTIQAALNRAGSLS